MESTPSPVAPGRRSSGGVTLQQRVGILAVVGVVATTAVAGVALVSLRWARSTSSQLATVSAGDRVFQSEQELNQEIVARVLESLYVTSLGADEERAQSQSEMAGLVATVGQDRAELDRLPLPDSLAGPTQRVEAELEAYGIAASADIDEIYGGQRTAVQAGLSDFLAASDRIQNSGDAVPFTAAVTRLDAQAGSSQSRAVRLIWLATALAMATLLAGARWVLWRMRRSLRAMSAAARRMADGDLSARVVHDTSDEVGQLAGSFNALAATLVTTFDRLELDARRENFNTRLVEALEMVDTELEVHRTVAVAFEQTGAHPTELLLSDSSRAHLQLSACHPVAGSPGCQVESPFQCAAVRRGHALVFPSSTDLNACPKLKDRPGGALSAACVPVSFMGRAIGVVHASGPDGEPPAPDVVGRLEQIAGLTGSRIGTVRAFQQTQLQAATDALTGLANRRIVEANLHELFTEGRLFSFVMADLDFFKRLNDSHGHEMGDRALRLFSRVCADSLRGTDLAARWGGEEFAAILPGVGAAEAAVIVEGLRARLAEATRVGDTPPFTASFGVVDSTAAANIDALVRAADNALYRAKEEGRDRVVIADTALLEPGARRFQDDHDARMVTEGPDPGRLLTSRLASP